MSKITFRADDDLVDQLEGLDISKSEAMREALRAYLETGEARTPDGETRDRTETALDDLVRERVDELLDERLTHERHTHPRTHANDSQDVNVTIALEGVEGSPESQSTTQAEPPAVDEPDAVDPRNRSQPPRQTTCGQCGEPVDDDHVYCPNCGEKATHRLFCECGDELRSDWSFCPGCGRRTPAADVLESS